MALPSALSKLLTGNALGKIKKPKARQLTYEESIARARLPSQPKVFTTAQGTTGTLLECGSDDNNCAFNCFSTYLVGNKRLALILRRIGAASLVAYLPDIYEAFAGKKITDHDAGGLYRLVEEDVSAARTVGGTAGQPICVALAEAFGVTLEYSYMDNAGVPVWEMYTAKSLAGIARRIHSPTSNAVLQHTGCDHWVLGRVTDSLPLWNEHTDGEIRSMLLEMLSTAEHTARASLFDIIRGVQLATDAFFAASGRKAVAILSDYTALSEGTFAVHGASLRKYKRRFGQ